MPGKLPPPPARILAPLPPELRAALSTAVEAPRLSDEALAWLEKVRRFASYAGRSLGRTARARFGAQADPQLGWMAQFLIDGGSRHPDRGGASVDPACLNAAFYCLDAASRPSPAAADALRRAEGQLLTTLLTADPVDPPAALGPIHDSVAGRWQSESAQCGRLVLISPNPVSLYSVAVLELCLRHGLPVAAILVRSFSLQRLAQEYKRDGLRLPRKVWRKLVLRADENAVTDGVSMKATVDALAPRHRDIRRTARAHGIPLLSIDGFVGCGAALRRLAPDLGLFTGGGMVDADTIAAFSRGVINVHLGQLPHYKGMDVVQAPLLEARRTLGASAHLMVPQLDAGPVLLRTDADAFAFTSLGALRNSLACMLPFMLVDAALGLCSGRLDPLDQPPAGRQFFITHPRLQAIIDALLKRRGGQSPSSAGSLEQRVGAALAAVGPGR